MESEATTIELPDAVRRVVRELGEIPAVREVWLFGSRVNGELRAESDWDLLVFAENATPSPTVRASDVDVFWVRSDDTAFLEAAPHDYAFVPLQWQVVDDGIAFYTARSDKHLRGLTSYDSDVPRFLFPRERAIRLWQRPAAGGDRPSA